MSSDRVILLYAVGQNNIGANKLFDVKTSVLRIFTRRCSCKKIAALLLMRLHQDDMSGIVQIYMRRDENWGIVANRLTLRDLH